MGNKSAKPVRKETPPPTSAPPASASSAPAQQPSASAPTATGATPTRSLLEAKLGRVDVAAVFTTQEILSIRKHLAAVLGLNENDTIVIPRDEFVRFLVGNSSSSLYVNRLYAIFDIDQKGHVTFEDLMKGLSILSQNASREQKLLLSFYLLDPDSTGYITKSMTTALLRSCIAECRELEISLSDEQIARIVDSTFEEADLDHNELIDLQEYQALDAKHPGLFDFLTVDAFGVLNHLEKVHSMSVTAGQ